MATTTYRTIQRSSTSWRETGEGEILNTGIETDDLHTALLDIAARETLEGDNNQHRWRIETDDEVDRDEFGEIDLAGEDIADDEVADYLRDALGEMLCEDPECDRAEDVHLAHKPEEQES